jgi:hypothetical protein
MVRLTLSGTQDLWQQVLQDNLVHSSVLSGSMLCSGKIELPIEKASPARERKKEKKYSIFLLICPI